MHEFSVVSSLIDMCESHASENGASAINEVKIKVGKLSGIELHLLKQAFDTFKEKTVCHKAKLTIHHQDVVVRCRSCEKESSIEKNRFICPACESIEIDVIDGEDMYLMSLEME